MSQELTRAQRQIRQNVRNFLLIATMPELELEAEIGDEMRKKFVREIIAERKAKHHHRKEDGPNENED